MHRLIVAAVALLTVSPASAQPPNPLAPLRFLVGEWRAIDTAAGERGAFVFRFDVQDHVLVRTNEAIYEAAPNRPASRHDDLMVIYADNGTIKADYFDNEGHVIRYAVQVDAARAVFVSDPDPKGPRFRLSYSLDQGVLNGSFEIATPDAPDAFKPYLAWKAVKR